MKLENWYYIDGVDLWTTFGIGVESGSDDLLRIPERKESVTHDWLDEDGLDVDVARHFYKAREATFRMHTIIKDTPDASKDFWEKYNQFVTMLRKPGLRRLTITEHGKDYYVFYKDSPAYERFTRIKGTDLIGCKFTIQFIETKPTIATTPTFIMDEDNRFIIT